MKKLMPSPRLPVCLFVLLAGLVSLFALPLPSDISPGGSAAAISRPANPSLETGMREAYLRLPLSFEANQGQWNEQVRFISRGSGYTLFLTPTEMTLTLARGHGSGVRDRRRTLGEGPTADHRPLPPSVLQMMLVGANPSAKVEGLDELPGKSNYLIGNDPTKWRMGITTHARVRYENVYPGVDLVYYGNQRQLEYDFIVAPEADPNCIQLKFSGEQEIEIAPGGDLIVRDRHGFIRQHKPAIYQQSEGVKKSVSGGYVLLSPNRVGFEVEEYDRNLPLIIDPTLSYFTYFGGAGNDRGLSLAVDSTGNTFITGDTAALDFPTTPGSFQNSNRGGKDAFVAKLNPSGTALLYSTYLGGNADDTGTGSDVDSNGSAYVTGFTASTDFPVANAFQVTPRGGIDAFVARLSPTGQSLAFSTYLGGNGDDAAMALSLDGTGAAYVVGGTASTNFPITGVAYQPVNRGQVDGFLTVIDASGIPRESTYLGGSANDQIFALALDGSGTVFLTGQTASTDFPTSTGAFRTSLRGSNDAFVCAIELTSSTAATPSYDLDINDGGSRVAASSFKFGTYLGGVSDDAGTGIVLDGAGNVYVAGFTFSPDFPTTTGSFQPLIRGGQDGFISKLRGPATLLASTYLGGSNDDLCERIAIIPPNGPVVVVGDTRSTDFPRIGGASGNTKLGSDSGIFAAVLNSSRLTANATLIVDGPGFESGASAAIVSLNNATSVRISGVAQSPGLGTPGTLFPSNQGGNDAFVLNWNVNDVPSGPESFVFPSLLSMRSGGNPAQHTGFAFTNLSNTSGNLTLEAFNPDGSRFTRPGIVNPVILNLNPGQQVPILDYQLFGSGLLTESFAGWMKADSNIGPLGTFSLTFNDTLDFLDGSTVPSLLLTEFVFTEFDNQGNNLFYVANPSAGTATVNMQLLGPDGAVRASSVQTVPGNGVGIFDFTVLFPGGDSAVTGRIELSAVTADYLRISSNKGVVPFQLFGKGRQYLSALNGQDANAGSMTLYCPQYVVGGTSFRSTLTIVNLSNTPGTLTLRFIGEDGRMISTQTSPIAAKGKIYISDQSFFITPGDTAIQGYLEITSNGPRLAGSVVFGDQGLNGFSSSLPLVSRLMRSFIFNQLASNATYFTGLALVNPNDSAVNAAIEVYDATGSLIFNKVENIPARQRKSRLLTEYIPGLVGQNRGSGYFRVRADKGVAGFALFGTNTLSVLSAIPPQEVP